MHAPSGIPEIPTTPPTLITVAHVTDIEVVGDNAKRVNSNAMKKTAILRIAALILFFVGVGVAMLIASSAIASEIIHVVNPETAPGDAIPAPFLAPPRGENYVRVQNLKKIPAPKGQPLARLNESATFQADTIEVFIPSAQAKNYDREIAFTILSSVRYSGNGHKLVISVAKPSAAVADVNIGLGNKQLQLANGTTAWANQGMPVETPNQIVFLRKGLIITVASDLSLKELKQLATEITFQ